MRTIDMTEALKWTSELIPQFASLQPKLMDLVHARNGIAHVGLGPESSVATEVLQPYLKAMGDLLLDMGENRTDFWGEFIDFVEYEVAQSAQRAGTRVLAKLKESKERFARRFGHLDSRERETALEGVLASYDVRSYEDVLYECPSCGTLALVIGNVVGEWEMDYEYEGPEEVSEHPYLTVRFFPHNLWCKACGLDLKGEEELVAAEVPESWELENVDPSDFMDEVRGEEYRDNYYEYMTDPRK
jgi:hypothetical protein